MSSTQDSPFRASRAVRTFDDIVVQIEDAIGSGAFPVGERLPAERELMHLFAASRSTVREALRLLEGRDMIRIRRGTKGGVFVSEPDARGVATALESLVRFRQAGARELAEFRPEFEAVNARLAADRATRSEKRQITDAAHDWVRSHASGAPWRELVELDLEMHQLIANFSKNEIRSAISLGLNRILRQASLALEGTDIDVDEGAQLIAIAETIESGDPAAAYEAMLAHVQSNSALELRALEQH